MDSPNEQKLIDKIIKSVVENEDISWWEYLEENLIFPFEAEVTERGHRSPIKKGDKVKVIGIFDFDEDHGIIVKAKFSRRLIYSVLSDLNITDKNDSNYIPFQAYLVGM